MHSLDKSSRRAARGRVLLTPMLAAALCVAQPAAAVSFNTYREITGSMPIFDFAGSDGAYPGRVFVANRSNLPVCVWQVFKGADGNVVKQSARPIYVAANSGGNAIQGPGEATVTMQFLLFFAKDGHCNWQPSLGAAIHLRPADSANGNVFGNFLIDYTFDGSQWGAKREIHVTVKNK